MKNNLMLNFSVDKENKKINVERAFAAPLATVWDAWTKSEILDQWWAPKPWKSETKSQEFREGGTWLYAMVGPKGEKHWSRADYETINDQESFTALDAFCDENGTITNEFPQGHWKCVFSEKGDQTVVSIEITYKASADVEKIIETGFQEGFTSGMENLDAVLEKK